MACLSAVDTTFIDVLLVEETVNKRRQASTVELTDLKPATWKSLPEELVVIVLLCLPAYSQARFRSVCKRWRELLTSSKDFREQTASVAFRRGGYPLYLVRVRGDETHHQALKCRTVDFPGSMLPREFLNRSSTVFISKPHLPLVGYAFRDDRPGFRYLRCGLLSLADKTYVELPPLVLLGVPRSWRIWLLPKNDRGTDFQVFVVHLCHSYTPLYHTYSSTSNSWESSSFNFRSLGEGPKRHIEMGLVCNSKGLVRLVTCAWDGEMTLVSWGGLSSMPLPRLPRPEVPKLLSDCSSGTVFAYGLSEDNMGLFLYKLDVLGPCEQWECLLDFYDVPPELLPAPSIWRVKKLQEAQIVGSIVLIPVMLQDCGLTRIMAYNVLDGACKWLQLAVRSPSWLVAPEVYF